MTSLYIGPASYWLVIIRECLESNEVSALQLMKPIPQYHLQNWHPSNPGKSSKRKPPDKVAPVRGRK